MKNKVSIENPILDTTNLDEYLNYAWLNLGDVRRLDYTNPLLTTDWEDSSKIPELIIQTCRDPQYLHFFIKYVLNIDILPFQCAIMQIMWHKALPMFIASRGASKSFTLAMYIICRAVLHQGCRIAVVGSSLRQSMVIFNYIQAIWNNAPVLRDICGGMKCGPKKAIHMAEWKCGNSHVYFLPLGDGSTIRGQRANVVVCDEFASVDKEIFETVVRGFAATKESDSVHSSVVKAAKRNIMKQYNLDDEVSAKEVKVPTMLGNNQIIMAGTAYYQFNHFYEYFKLYKAIILSGGDREVLKRDFPDKSVDVNLDPADYAIIRLPYDMIPEGMMDSKMLSQGRATMDPTIFDMEYGAAFPSDSDGFYLASHLNAATCPININGDIFDIPARLYGVADSKYIMGVDPASEDDNFAICIIEVSKSCRTIVYMWTTNRKLYEEHKREGLIDKDINDYQTYCIKHIRDLKRRFGVSLILCDTGGGGVSIREGLKDPDKMMDGDIAILDMDDENTYQMQGERILKMIEFSDSSWRREAHYGLRKDIIDKLLLFPKYDSVAIELEKINTDKSLDSIESIYDEIQECKTETTMIRHTQTLTGSEKWDVPDIHGISAEQKRKMLKRDRFTALLLANWGCRISNEKVYSSNNVYTHVQRGSLMNTSGSAVNNVRKLVTKQGGKVYY